MKVGQMIFSDNGNRSGLTDNITVTQTKNSHHQMIIRLKLNCTALQLLFNVSVQSQFQTKMKIFQNASPSFTNQRRRITRPKTRPETRRTNCQTTNQCQTVSLYSFDSSNLIEAFSAAKKATVNPTGQRGAGDMWKFYTEDSPGIKVSSSRRFFSKSHKLFRLAQSQCWLCRSCSLPLFSFSTFGVNTPVHKLIPDLQIN